MHFSHSGVCYWSFVRDVWRTYEVIFVFSHSAFHWVRPINNIASEKYPHNLRAKLFNMPPNIDTCQNGQHYQKPNRNHYGSQNRQGLFLFCPIYGYCLFKRDQLFAIAFNGIYGIISYRIFIEISAFNKAERQCTAVSVVVKEFVGVRYQFFVIWYTIIFFTTVIQQEPFAANFASLKGDGGNPKLIFGRSIGLCAI